MDWKSENKLNIKMKFDDDDGNIFIESHFKWVREKKTYICDHDWYGVIIYRMSVHPFC